MFYRLPPSLSKGESTGFCEIIPVPQGISLCALPVLLPLWSQPPLPTAIHHPFSHFYFIQSLLSDEIFIYPADYYYSGNWLPLLLVLVMASHPRAIPCSQTLAWFRILSIPFWWALLWSVLGAGWQAGWGRANAWNGKDCSWRGLAQLQSWPLKRKAVKADFISIGA